MKKISIIVIMSGIFLVIIPAAMAQQAGSISGMVKDTNARIINGATVYLTKAGDSALVKTVFTDSGRFIFRNVADGNYRVIVTNVGFKKYYSADITISATQPETVPQDISMTPAERGTLEEVMVYGKKPFLERKVDRTIVNVDAFISAAGTNSFELLEKLPGVGVDIDGNITLKGKSGARIFVDNKPIYLSGPDLTGYLKSLTSSTIERVELIPNPPARYEAEGAGGIINIILKKNRQRGFNGSANLSYGQGQYEKVNASVNLNYRLDKLNFFANISASESRDFEKAMKTRAYTKENKEITSRFSQPGFTRFDRSSYSIRAGMDYMASKNTTWGIVLNGIIKPSKDLGGNTSYLLNRNFVVDSSVVFDNKSDNKWRSGSINMNMVHRFKKPGTELSVDADYATYKTGSNQVFDYSYYDAAGNLQYTNSLLGDLPRKINIYSIRADLSFRIKGGIGVETGIKSSLVQTTNDADYFTRKNGTVAPDYAKTNSFLYDENINAAYISANKKFNRLELKAGLRMEHTYSKGHQLGNAIVRDSTFKRDYVTLFPTFFASYKFDTLDKHQLVFSYGRRINRPSYQLLNPFLSFVDKYYQEAGNPFLRPQLSQSSELTYTYKRFLDIGIFYDILTNTFNRVIELADSNTFINRPANVGKIKNLGILITVDLKPAKFWSLNVYCEMGRKRVQSVFNGIHVDSAINFYTFQLRNQFNLKKGWSIDLNGFIASRDFTGQFVVRPLGELSAGIQKRFKVSSLTLSARDLLYTRISKGTILNIPGVEATFDNRRDSRVVTLSYNYRFGKGNTPNRRRRISSEEE